MTYLYSFNLDYNLQALKNNPFLCLHTHTLHAVAGKQRNIWQLCRQPDAEGRSGWLTASLCNTWRLLIRRQGQKRGVITAHNPTVEIWTHVAWHPSWHSENKSLPEYQTFDKAVNLKSLSVFNLGLITNAFSRMYKSTYLTIKSLLYSQCVLLSIALLNSDHS